PACGATWTHGATRSDWDRRTRGSSTMRPTRARGSSRTGSSMRRRLSLGACGPDAEAIGCAHELVNDARLEAGVARIGHDAEIRFRPGSMERPRRLHRTDHIVASLHDHRGDLANALHVSQQLIFSLEEAL